MVILKPIIYSLLAFVLIEVLLELLVDKIRLRFQWLITRKKDYLPEIDKNGLKKFLADGFDGELGWVRKPNTENSETGRFGKTVWHTNEYGARLNPGFEGMAIKISCYGDSFTFCRQVNDNETWEHYLSLQTGTNVLNWGVGNHGIDQSFLRLKREYPNHPTDILVLGFVPDTISRILSTWKHFYEYGNTFGFKPRYFTKNEETYLVKNPIDSAEKFLKIKDFLDEIKQTDFFYKNKFKKEIISFPYIYSVFKSPLRNIPLIYWNAMALMGSDPEKYIASAKQKIMEINLDCRLRLYNDSNTTNLLVSIISMFYDFSLKNNCKIVIVFLPQKDDIIYLRRHGHFYQSVLDTLKGDMLTVDLAADFLNINDVDGYFSDDTTYGGHYSAAGNDLVAQSLINTLKMNHYIG